jgi:hypothetical protein
MDSRRHTCPRVLIAPLPRLQCLKLCGEAHIGISGLPDVCGLIVRDEFGATARRAIRSWKCRITCTSLLVQQVAFRGPEVNSLAPMCGQVFEFIQGVNVKGCIGSMQYPRSKYLCGRHTQTIPSRDLGIGIVADH